MIAVLRTADFVRIYTALLQTYFVMSFTHIHRSPGRKNTLRIAIASVR